MNKNKIQNDDDSFFQPKDIEKRDKEERKKQKEFLSKIKLGLQNVKRDYKSSKWNSKEEKLFLQMFSKLHLDEKYDERWEGYTLKNERNKISCFLDLKTDMFCILYNDIWAIFRTEFNWNYDKIKLFMEQMLNKHLKFYEFIVELASIKTGL